jgi:hypothetical protein
MRFLTTGKPAFARVNNATASELQLLVEAGRRAAA